MVHASHLSIALVVTIAAAINVLASSGSMTRNRVTRKSEEKHKFISFETDDETIEMAVEFSVPFLQVPKSLGKFSSSLARGQNPATINFGAILLLSIIAVIGTVIGNFWAPGTSMMNSPGLTSLFKTDADSSTSNNWIWTSVKDSMLKEDGMLNDCAKKFVCLTTAEAIERRRHGINSQLDSLIEGVTRRVHLRDVQPGVSVSMAIERAFSGGCSGHFNNCSAKIQPLQHYLIQ